MNQMVQRTAEIPQARFIDRIVDAAKLFPRERVSERIMQQVMDVMVPQITKKVLEWIVEQIMDVMVPQITKEISESVDVDMEKTAEISQI